MILAIQLHDQTIQLGAIREGPEYSVQFLTMLGLVYMNWGRLEQTLEFLLHFTNDQRLVTGAIPKFPDTSFRLKVAIFKRTYAEHPRFESVHHLARPVFTGLKKANKQRVKLVHSNFQYFKDGPPETMEVTLTKFRGADLQTWHGSWTLQALLDFNELLCLLNDDLAKIAAVVITPEFLQLLERPLSRTQKAFLWVRRHLSRWPRLRIERPFPRF